MGKETCRVCGREIDSRGMSGHMRTHKIKSSDKVLYGHEGEGIGGVISYPSNEQKIENKTQIEQPKKKKAVKKIVASKPASSPASSPANKPDPRGQRKTETNVGSKNTAHLKDSGAHKKEWQGFFRE